MDKIIGFTLTHHPAIAPFPPYLSAYPHLTTIRHTYKHWDVTLWGHGDLSKFISGNRIIIGYTDVELATIPHSPHLHNRGLVIELSDTACAIRNDTLGQIPVLYARKTIPLPQADATVPIVSTCEESIIRAIAPVTLDPARLVNFLTYQTSILTYTLWSEINRLYANRILRATTTGAFEQLPQPALTFSPVDSRKVVDRLTDISRHTVRRYTDSLDTFFLPLSAGQDSRTILAFSQRPSRILARSYPTSWPADKNIEVAVAKASAAKCGCHNFSILDFHRDFSPSTKPFLDYCGALVSALQVYLFAASSMLGDERTGIPVLSGITGDVTAGVATRHTDRWLAQSPNAATAFKLSCYCHANEWMPEHLSSCLTFDHCAALEPLHKSWARCWRETEGISLERRSALIRLRNRCPTTITYAWSAIELWNPMVTPFLDRDYLTFTLALPSMALPRRTAQQQMLSTHTNFWQYAGIPYSKLDARNTINVDTITDNPRAFYPLVPDGSKPTHPLFKPHGIAALYTHAIAGHKPSWGLLASLQPIAWAIDKGYVK